jgi:hypothetical protein
MISVVAIYCVLWLLCIYGTYLLCRDHMIVDLSRVPVTSRLTACVKNPTEPVGYVGRASGVLSAWDTTKSIARDVGEGVTAVFTLDTQRLLRGSSSNAALVMNYMMLGILVAFLTTLAVVFLMLHASKFLMAGFGSLAALYARDKHAKEMVFSLGAGAVEPDGIGERLKKVGTAVVTEVLSLRGVGPAWYMPRSLTSAESGKDFFLTSRRGRIMDFVLTWNAKLGRLLLAYATTFLSFLVVCLSTFAYGLSDIDAEGPSLTVSFGTLAAAGTVVLIMMNLLAPPLS